MSTMQTTAPTTWEDVLAMPEDDVVDAWRFGRSPGHERFTGEIPVRIRGEQVGAIDLEEIFSRHLDVWPESSTA